MKICFTETVTTKSATPRTFRKGEVHDFPEDVANRWLRRNKAEVALDEPKPRAVPAYADSSGSGSTGSSETKASAEAVPHIPPAPKVGPTPVPAAAAKPAPAPAPKKE